MCAISCPPTGPGHAVISREDVAGMLKSKRDWSPQGGPALTQSSGQGQAGTWSPPVSWTVLFPPPCTGQGGHSPSPALEACVQVPSLQGSSEAQLPARGPEAEGISAVQTSCLLPRIFSLIKERGNVSQSKQTARFMEDKQTLYGASRIHFPRWLGKPSRKQIPSPWGSI